MAVLYGCYKPHSQAWGESLGMRLGCYTCKVWRFTYSCWTCSMRLVNFSNCSLSKVLMNTWMCVCMSLEENITISLQPKNKVRRLYKEHTLIHSRVLWNVLHFLSLGSCPARVHLLVRNGLVNQVKFRRPITKDQWNCAIANYYIALPLQQFAFVWKGMLQNVLNVARLHKSVH